MNTSKTGSKYLPYNTPTTELISKAEGVLEELQHIFETGYNKTPEELFKRASDLLSYSTNIRNTLCYVVNRNISRGYYWKDRMIWEAFNRHLPGFKDFTRVHYLILGYPETRIYIPEVKQDASVIVHGYLLQAGRSLGIVLPYPIRHHIQKFIFYWKTPDVQYQPSWIVSGDASRSFFDNGAITSFIRTALSHAIATTTENEMSRVVNGYLRAATLEHANNNNRTVTEYIPGSLIDPGATRLVGNFTSVTTAASSNTPTTPPTPAQLTQRSERERQELNMKFGGLSPYPLR